MDTSPTEQAQEELCHTLLQVVKDINTQQIQLSETIKDMT